MTSSGPQGDALQQIGGNEGAGHGGSLTMAIPRIAQKCGAFWSCDGLMSFRCDRLQHAHRQVTFGLTDHRGRISSRVLDGMPSHVSG